MVTLFLKLIHRTMYTSIQLLYAPFMGIVFIYSKNSWQDRRILQEGRREGRAYLKKKENKPRHNNLIWESSSITWDWQDQLKYRKTGGLNIAGKIQVFYVCAFDLGCNWLIKLENWKVRDVGVAPTLSRLPFPPIKFYLWPQTSTLSPIGEDII